MRILTSSRPLLLGLAAVAVIVAATVAVMLATGGEAQPDTDRAPEEAVAGTTPAPEPVAPSDNAAADASPSPQAAPERSDQEEPAEPPVDPETELEAPEPAQAPEPGSAEAPAATEPTAGAEPPASQEEAGAEGAQPGEAPITVNPASMPQGHTAAVTVSGVDAGSALLTVGGFTSSMARVEGVWMGFHPVPPLTPPGPYRVIVDFFDTAGAYQQTVLGTLTVIDANPEVQAITLDPGEEQLLAPELVAIDNNVRFIENRAVSGPPRWRGAWRIPVDGPFNGPFGVLRSYNGAPPRDWHHGFDIAADTGTPIHAAAPGRAVFAGELPVHGKGVIMDHGGGVYSGYWHMSAIGAALGDNLETGTVIGQVGDTGLAVGAHLHWEVIVHGRDVDPLQWVQQTLGPR